MPDYGRWPPSPRREEGDRDTVLTRVTTELGGMMNGPDDTRDARDLQTTIRNEQTKLLAIALNTAATSSFTIGVLAPLAAAVYTATPAVPLRIIVPAASGWILAAVILHLLARRALRRLRRE